MFNANHYKDLERQKRLLNIQALHTMTTKAVQAIKDGKDARQELQDLAETCAGIFESYEIDDGKSLVVYVSE